MNMLCYIQARKGSKRFPGKNKKLLHGVPLYRRAYDIAVMSNLFDTVVISTDDEEIHADKSVQTIERSVAAAADDATDDDVARDVLDRVGKRNIVCKLYPTAFMLEPHYLTFANFRLIADGLDGVRGVMEYEHPPQRNMYFSGPLLQWDEPSYAQQSRFLPSYFDCGAFMFFRTDSFYHQGTLDMDAVGGVVISRWHHQDINTENDFELARLKYEHMA